jgi:hypothetical protein
MRGTPKEIALILRRRANVLEKRVRDAEEASAKEALKLAQYLSTGLYSTAKLRQMGHPYAKRLPRPRGDRAMINYQTGNFYRGWRIRGPRRTSKGLVTKLVNVSREAAFFADPRGTRTMIARPIKDRILERLYNTRRRLLDRAMRSSLSGR